MKIFTALCLLGAVAIGGVAYANGDHSDETEGIDEAETTTLSDLEGGDPTLLPTSPLYFFKEMKRGFQRAFTFNSIDKAELELKFANEKAAELKKVEENSPNDTSALERALENYQNGQERLKRKFESLRETSENPNIDRLLEKLAERTVRHEKLFEELEAKHDTLKSAIRNVRVRVEETADTASELDTPEKFKARFERAFEGSRGSALKHLRSIDIAERLGLEDLREELSEKVRSRIDDFAEGEDGDQRIKDLIEHMPGDAFRRSAILEDIRARVKERAAKTLEDIQEGFDRDAEKHIDVAERAEAQIEKAEEAIKKAEAEAGEVSLIANAKAHLESAKSALSDGQPGRAFGQARSAEALAKNALRILERRSGDTDELPERLDRVRERIIDFRSREDDADEEDRPTRESERDEVRCTYGDPLPEWIEACEARGGEVRTKRDEGPPCIISPVCVTGDERKEN